MTNNKIFTKQLGGILADKFDKKKLLVTYDSIATVLVWTYILAHRNGNLFYLYAAVVFRSGLTALYRPVSVSIAPMFVSDPRDLKKITVLSGINWSVTFMIGGMLGGFLSAAIGVEACYLFDSFTYFLSVFLVQRGIVGTFKVKNPSKDHTMESIFETKVDFDSEKKKTISRRARESISRCFEPLCLCLHPVKQLFSYLFTCGFGLLVLMQASGAMTWGSEDVLNILISKVPGDEDESSRRLGMLVSYQGLGSFIGPLLVNGLLVDGRKPYTIQTSCIACFFFIIFGWIGIAHSPIFGLMCFFTFFRCLGGSAIWLNSTLLLQNLTRPEMLGRVIATAEMITALFLTITAYIAGNLEDKGFGKEEIALMSIGISGFFIVFWSTYHIFGFGAARKESMYVAEQNISRKGSIDMVHSPAAV